MLFEEITVFKSYRFGTSIWDPPGLLLGGYLAPNQFETGLLGALGPSRSRFQYLLGGPRGLQERPKRHPRAPHTSLEALLWPIKPFQELQEASKTPTRDLQGSFGTRVGTIWEQCCKHVNAMLPPCWSRILAEGSCAKGPRSKAPGLAECA